MYTVFENKPPSNYCLPFAGTLNLLTHFTASPHHMYTIIDKVKYFSITIRPCQPTAVVGCSLTCSLGRCQSTYTTQSGLDQLNRKLSVD